MLLLPYGPIKHAGIHRYQGSKFAGSNPPLLIPDNHLRDPTTQLNLNDLVVSNRFKSGRAFQSKEIDPTRQVPYFNAVVHAARETSIFFNIVDHGIHFRTMALQTPAAFTGRNTPDPDGMVVRTRYKGISSTRKRSH